MTRFWPCADLAIAKLWLGHWPGHTSKHTPKYICFVRLVGWAEPDWPAHSQKHCSRPDRTVFFSHTNQPEQYFSLFFSPAEQAIRSIVYPHIPEVSLPLHLHSHFNDIVLLQSACSRAERLYHIHAFEIWLRPYYGIWIRGRKQQFSQ